MKLIIQDLQETVIDLEEPEITIKDKKNPDRTYSFSPIGGYIKFVADYDHNAYRTDMGAISKIITIDMGGKHEA